MIQNLKARLILTMILIDYSQIAIANIVIAFKRDGEIPTPETARFMILNQIRGYVHQYKEEYGPEVVIAVDGAKPWRRDIFPAYKAKRRESKEGQSEENIIAVCIKKSVKKWFTTKYLIISSDKDFQQLQKYPNVTQYSPVLKKFYETDSPQEYIYEHILRGDAGDGIPNFLSPDDTFINGIKSKPIMKKKTPKRNWKRS